MCHPVCIRPLIDHRVAVERQAGYTPAAVNQVPNIEHIKRELQFVLSPEDIEILRDPEIDSVQPGEFGSVPLCHLTPHGAQVGMLINKSVEVISVILCSSGYFYLITLGIF